jgi:nucleoside-diphosphate-sugar epimerase
MRDEPAHRSGGDVLQNEKILLTGPNGQVAFPLARALAAHNDVTGLARFGKPEDRERLEALGVRCVAADRRETSTTTSPPTPRDSAA